MTTRHRTRGFTILELIISMAIFTMLGTMVIYLMTQSLDMFQQGIEEAGTLDRQDAVIPVIEEDLRAIKVVANTEAPPKPRETDDLTARAPEKPLPPPRVDVRLRSGRVKLKESGKLKDFTARYIAFVIDISEGLDPTIAQLDTSGGPEAIDITPKSVGTATRETLFKATRGLMEICYVVVPTRPDRPDILTVYRGFRSPVGDPEHSLLDAENLDTIEEIQKACEPVSDGILHFGVTWRRVFARSWEEDTRRLGQSGDLTRYVGPDWDSTRGADEKWPMFVKKESLTDPSDDVFPLFVRLEVAMATPTRFGYSTGEVRLLRPVAKDDRKIFVDDVDALFRPGLGREGWIKVGTEWMGYSTDDIDYQKHEVTVVRGGRGTAAEAHREDAGGHLGSTTRTEVRLPVFRDRFTMPETR